MFKGNRFKIDRTTRISHGSAKGLWYHGTATITGENTTPFKRVGWVKVTAFSWAAVIAAPSNAASGSAIPPSHTVGVAG